MRGQRKGLLIVLVAVTLSSLLATLMLEESTMVVEEINNAYSLRRSTTSLSFPSLSNRQMPKIIWMYWNQGWEHADEEATFCRKTWEMMNPAYQIKALDETEMELVTNRSAYIPDHIWRDVGIASRADIYRTLLLHRYGGVWADASVTAAVPLDSWLDDQPDLLAFIRHDNMKEQKTAKIDPWIASWFLAAPPGSYMVGRIMDIMSSPKEWHRFTEEYFWFHRIVSELAQSDERFGRRICNSFPSADPLHGDATRFGDRAPMFKRFALPKMKMIVEDYDKCCRDFQQLTNSGGVALQGCRNWDCSSLGANWYRVPDAAPAPFGRGTKG